MQNNKSPRRLIIKPVIKVDSRNEGFQQLEERKKQSDAVLLNMTEINKNKNDSFNIKNEYANWYEIRLSGKYPERRGHHSSFLYNKK